MTATSLSSDPRRVTELARTLGVPGVLFDAYVPNLSLPELSITGRREFHLLLRNQDRQIVGLRVDLGQSGLSPKSDIDQQLSRIEKAMETAKGLAAPLVCVDLGPLPSPAKVQPPRPRVTPDMAGLILLPNLPDPPAAEPDAMQTPADLSFIAHLDAVMHELGRRADRYGVMLAFRSDLASLAAVERTMAAASCPWFGIDLDPVALLRDGADLDKTFDAIGPLIRHVRARDAVLGAGHRTRPAAIGLGGVDWPHLLANLDAAGYYGWLTIDPVELPDRLTATSSAVAHLTKIAAQ